MTTPDADPTIHADTRETVVTPRPSPPADDRTTINLDVIDLRDEATPTVASATILVPQQTGPPVPQEQPVEVLRFGPGVPAALAAPPIAAVAAAPPVRKLSRNRALNWVLTLALAAIVIWLLWPTGKLHVRAVSTKANPAAVSCNSSADVVATVTTNGNPGQLKYRWIRNNGSGSGTLVQSLSRGQHSVNLHLTWTFRGPGTYNAQATVQLLTPGTPSATVNFRYAC